MLMSTAPLSVMAILKPASLFFTIVPGQILDPEPIWVPSLGVRSVLEQATMEYFELMASTKHGSDPYLVLNSSSVLQWSDGA